MLIRFKKNSLSRRVCTNCAVNLSMKLVNICFWVAL